MEMDISICLVKELDTWLRVFLVFINGLIFFNTFRVKFYIATSIVKIANEVVFFP